MYKFKTLKDHVYDYIAEKILVGNLKPNEKIDENTICSELNISRTPVREALIQLAGDGILDNVPRKGYVVKGMDLEEISELYVVIGRLDGLAAMLSLPNLTDKDYRDMEFYIESMDIAINSEHYEMYNRQQNEFHEIYIRKCGNQTLIEQLNKLRNKLLKQNFGTIDSPEASKILQDTNDEHREILRLMKNGDAAKLNDYLVDPHWSVDKARFDLLVYE